MQLRMECLDDHLHQLRALTGMLASADAKLVRKSVDAVASLPSVQRCADVAALTAPVPPPVDPATRAKVEALRKRLAELQAADLSGRSSSLLGASEAVVASARALGYAPVLAEALKLRGTVLDNSGDHKAAEVTLYEAFTTAYAGHHDAAAAEIAESLISLVGYWLARQSDGHRWAEMSLAALRRLGGNDETEAWLRRDEAWVYYQEGNADKAVESAERAFALGKKVFGADSLSLAKIHSTLATAYGRKRRYAEALDHDQQALAIMEKTYGRDHQSVSSVLTSLGTLYADQHKFVESERYRRDALDILERVLGPDHPTTGIGHFNLGNSLQALRKTSEALDHYRAALRIAEKGFAADHPLTLHAMGGVGSCLVDLGKAGEAVGILERAQAIADQRTMDNDVRIDIGFSLARALWDSGRDRPGAIARMRKVRALAEAEGDKFNVGAADQWLASTQKR
jgi:tetratricopeptide (TPR) repeat protein